MKILAWMLTRMVAVRFLAILLGVSIFVLSLEVLSYVDDILALRPGHMSIILDYVLARAPSVLSTYLPLSMRPRASRSSFTQRGCTRITTR